MNSTTIMVIAVIVLIVLIALYVGATYNALIRKRNSVDEAFATMDVYLKKRWDLIPNLVSTVKGYAKHEAETLEKVIAARNGGYNNLSDEEKIEANKEISRGIANINVVAEQYPDLKANQNFMNLQNQLNGTENDIANARKYYNAIVKLYNNKVQMFPSSIVASMFHFNTKQMFAIENTAEREAVKVEF